MSQAHSIPVTAPIVPPATVETLEQKFQRLTAEWKEETRFSSKTKAIAEHPAYRQIIEMGKPAVPLILADLEKNGGHWFMALDAITGADPVAEDDAGKTKKMAAAWIAWGRAKGNSDYGAA